jgi:hypothetical protein
MTMACELARYGVPVRIVAGAGLKPGQRVGPQAGQEPVGAGSEPRFALFAANTAATADLVGRFPELLDGNVRPPFHDGGIWLVRPDGYLRLFVQ